MEGLLCCFSNVFSDMFDDMFDMPAANQNAKGLMNCDVKEYDDHYELDLDMAGFQEGRYQGRAEGRLPDH